MSMIKRCWTRLKSQIPKDQAAYRPGMSTTEQVFSLKMHAEKAITTNNYTIFILMLDMSKAFDSIDRKKLMGYLREILTESELYMMNRCSQCFRWEGIWQEYFHKYWVLSRRLLISFLFHPVPCESH